MLEEKRDQDDDDVHEWNEKETEIQKHDDTNRAESEVCIQCWCCHWVRCLSCSQEGSWRTWTGIGMRLRLLLMKEIVMRMSVEVMWLQSHRSHSQGDQQHPCHGS